MTGEKQTYKIFFKDGTSVLIEAQTEAHARQAITRGRKVGRYTKSRTVKVEAMGTGAPETVKTHEIGS